MATQSKLMGVIRVAWMSVAAVVGLVGALALDRKKSNTRREAHA